jgi:hypothetical protein
MYNIEWLLSQPISPILQDIVFTNGSGGITTEDRYMYLKAASEKGDFHLLQQLKRAQKQENQAAQRQDPTLMGVTC